MKNIRSTKLISLFILALFLAGCEGFEFPDSDPIEEPERETIFGPGGIDLFGGDDKKAADAREGGSIGVNAFLWRATLDTMSVWPIMSADPFGGVILTDWYSPPNIPNERFKMNIYILDRTLRADGVRVSVFRQIRTVDNGWKDAAVQPGTATKLEDAILMRARQFRGRRAE